jgi:hypothetical protein
MMHEEAVNKELLDLATRLFALPQLDSFRLVGGTAAALHLGHRISIDLDLFSNEKINKREIVNAISQAFPNAKTFISTFNIRSAINDIKVEMYDDWHTPFKKDPLNIKGLRIATLEDIAAFKLEAITERREKKDYIDLHFIFKALGDLAVLNSFQDYNPYISIKSVLFALGEVEEAHANKSVMPEMLVSVDWQEVKISMLNAAKRFIAVRGGESLTN